MYRILNVEPDRYSREARAVLETVARVDEDPLDREQLLQVITAYDVLIVRLAHVIDDEILRHGVRLKAIATATTGLDHIDLKAAEKRGIAVISLRGQYEFLRSIHATAEHTWALLLSLLRNIPAAFDSVKRGEWDRDQFRGGELYDKTLGIVGMGRIGEKIARYGEVFGMKIIAYDPYRPGVQSCQTLDDLLSQTQVVSIHVPLNHETTGLIGARELALLPRGALLINTSRGAIVDENALVAALEKGHLGGAALDVLAEEQVFPTETAQKLLAYAQRHHNLIMTPHIGGATAESMAKTEIFIAHKVKQFLASFTTALK